MHYPYVMEREEEPKGNKIHGLQQRRLPVTQATHFLIFPRLVEMTITRKLKASHSMQKFPSDLNSFYKNC